MNATVNRVSYSQLPDSNTSCVPAFASRFSQAISYEVEKPSSGMDREKKEKTFPWLLSFSKQCCAAVGNKSVKQVESLIMSYIEHVTPHYKECQKLPNKAFKLKRNINHTMVFLHLLYSDLDEPLENGFYHEKMAQVMAMYVDLEITAFRRGKESVKEVYNRLSSSIYTFLDHSDDHILDALLRTQLVNKHSKNLCSPFLRKVLTELVVCRPLSALTYVRYVLAFKLWKSVVAEANEKKAINKIALQRLHPPPKFFQDHDICKHSADILPKVPKNKKNCSQYYLQAKLNLKDACRALFKFCRESTCQEEAVYLPSFPEKSQEVESNGCVGLINEIWCSMSNDKSNDTSLLGKSEVFSEDRMFCDDMCDRGEVATSPDSKKSNDHVERDKIPDSTYVMYPDSQEGKSEEENVASSTQQASPSPSPSPVLVEHISVKEEERIQVEWPSPETLAYQQVIYAFCEKDSDGGRNRHSSNCHLPLKKRKLAASSDFQTEGLEKRDLASTDCLEPRSVSRQSGVSVSYSCPHVSAEVPDNLQILAEEAVRIWEERAQGSVQSSFGMLASQSNAVQSDHMNIAEEAARIWGERTQGSVRSLEANHVKNLAEEAARIWEERRAQGSMQSSFGMLASQSNAVQLDYLKNLAEEAASEWEERNVQSAFGMLASQTNVVQAEYLTPGRMMSIAEAIQDTSQKKIKVIVEKVNAGTNASQVEVERRNYQPIDMSGAKCVERNAKVEGTCNGKKSRVHHISKKSTSKSEEKKDKKKSEPCCAQGQCCDSSRCDDSRCDICASASATCKGKCKSKSWALTTKIAKCIYCKSTCFGTCRLAEKKQLRCNQCNKCNTAGCKGKCSMAICNFCYEKNCSGACRGACRIQHSVDSILGSSTSEGASAFQSETNRRRTRNSQTKSQTKSPPDPKRRKKSVSR